MSTTRDSIARLMAEALAGTQSRRAILRRAAALGVSGPLAGVLLAAGRQRTAFAQGTPSAAPSGDPIRIGAAVSTTGSNGRTGLYQQEAYLLWEAQKNANGGLLGRPVEMVIQDDQSDPTTGARLYERLITEEEVDLVLSASPHRGEPASLITMAANEATTMERLARWWRRATKATASTSKPTKAATVRWIHSIHAAVSPRGGTSCP